MLPGTITQQPEAALNENILFYLQDIRTLCGSNVVFWNKGGRGYGTNLDKLETYTLEQAQRQHNSRESDVPLLKSAVDAMSIIAVDCQVLPESGSCDDQDKYVVQLKGAWNGNDILFVGFHGNTYDYNKVQSFSNEGIDMEGFDPDCFDVFSKSEIDKIARRTFQSENIDIKNMITEPGIKLIKLKTYKQQFRCGHCGAFQTEQNYYTGCTNCGKDNMP